MQLETRADYIILERNGSGHRSHYVRYLAEVLSRQGLPVYLGIDESMLANDYLRQNVFVRANVTIRIVPHGASAMVGLRYLISSHPRDRSLVVVIPDGDYFALRPWKLAALQRTLSIRILVMRANSQNGDSALANVRQVARTVLLRLSALLPSTKVFVLRPSSTIVNIKSCSLSDVIDPVDVSYTSADQDEVGHLFAGDSPVVTVCGFVDERKNVPLVLDAMEVSEEKWTLLLAGTISASVLNHVRQRGTLLTSGRVLLLNHALSDGALNAIVASSDAVAVIHSNDGPSGILGKALALGTPALVGGSPTLRAEVKGVAGYAVVDLSAKEVADGLRKVLRGPRPIPQQTGTVENFASELLFGPQRDHFG